MDLAKRGGAGWISKFCPAKGSISGHFQRVQVHCEGKTHRSQLASNPVGIYQGTALGPLLFSIFSNDMHMHIDPSVTLIQYADDSQLAVCGKKEELPQLISRLEATLATAKEWFSSRKMKINAAKTQLVTFGTKQLLQGVPPIQINFDGETITESSKVRNLGVTMDRHMTFRPHLDQITGCCTGILLGLTARAGKSCRSAVLIGDKFMSFGDKF